MCGSLSFLVVDQVAPIADTVPLRTPRHVMTWAKRRRLQAHDNSVTEEVSTLSQKPNDSGMALHKQVFNMKLNKHQVRLYLH